MRKHEEFILSPIEQILEDVGMATSSVNVGLHSYPLCEYVMHSTFLKLTGYQEQKLKCISWELATDNYRHRYERYKRKPLGECSSYEDKKMVFDDLVRLTHELDGTYKGLTSVELQEIYTETSVALISFYRQSKIKGWMEKPFSDFSQLTRLCGAQCLAFFNNNGLMTDIVGHCDNCSHRSATPPAVACEIGQIANVRRVFDSVIMHRNRCAHNTISAQRNLPSLSTMKSMDYLFENYFLRFAMLIYIDKIFVRLFRNYLKVIDNDFEI